MTGQTRQATSGANDSLPPVAELGVGALICTMTSGIIVAAQVPNTTLMWPSIVLLVVAAGFLVSAVTLLARAQNFAWRRFRQVWQWAMLAYIVIAGMLEYVFVKDNTPTNMMIMLTLLLIAFALTVPLLMAFSVARFVGDDGPETH